MSCTNMANFSKTSPTPAGPSNGRSSAGGLAVGVHPPQFAIREVGMYRSVLELAAETAASWTKQPLAMVAGLVGPTSQAIVEAKIARGIGYHAGLLSLAAMKSASEDEI